MTVDVYQYNYLCKNKTKLWHVQLCHLLLKYYVPFSFQPKIIVVNMLHHRKQYDWLTQDPSPHTITHKEKCVNLRWWTADTDIHLGKDNEIGREFERRWRRVDKAEIFCICEAYSEEKTE